MKWFQHQKKISTGLIDEMTKAKKMTTYSIMKYGSRATMEVPFASQQRRAEIESSIERMSEPQGKGDLENALETAFTEMFPALPSTTSAFEFNRDEYFTRKTMILFVERKEVSSYSTNGGISDEAFEYARELRQNRGVTILAVVMGNDDVVNDDGDGEKANLENVEKLVGQQGKVIIIRDANKFQDNSILDLPDILDELKKKGSVFFYLPFR